VFGGVNVWVYVVFDDGVFTAVFSGLFHQQVVSFVSDTQSVDALAVVVIVVQLEQLDLSLFKSGE
jgi:hypothetical protein